MRRLLNATADYVADYLDSLQQRHVAPSFPGFSPEVTTLPQHPVPPEQVLEVLNRTVTPAAVASAGGRYFGFVTGGTLPAALAADWLVSGWDQNVAFEVMSPPLAALEEVTLDWLAQLLSLPAGGGGFVTGGSMANFTCLAAARHRLLAEQGWDVEADGLWGAPPLTVVVGEEAHSTLLQALALLGLGRERVVRVPVDDQGRLRGEALPDIDGPVLLCLQAGNVNTGAFDPFPEAVEWARSRGSSWVHVDGAFGLWAAASPHTAPLLHGADGADSWSTDAHKWLNVPYDAGVALVREPEWLRSAMSATAAYLPGSTRRQPSDYTPELSRRGRVVPVWAALASLGRSGVAELVERCCRHARRLASGLSEAGHEVLNQVVLNQVLVSFGEAARTDLVVEAIQTDGTCWCGSTTWQGRRAMRISVSSWATSDDDVERSLKAMLRVAAAPRKSAGGREQG